MNYWPTEELMWLNCAEREREAKAHRLYNEVNKLRADLTIVAQVALKLSDWLITSGERLRRHYDKAATVSPFITKQNFAR